MPPKRKSKAAADPATDPPKRTRQSRLAKEHGISAHEEDQIREAYSLFSEPHRGEADGVLLIDDLRSAMVALGVPPTDRAELEDFVSILDPDSEGFTTFEPFVAICALKMHARDDDGDAHQRELDDAFRLFMHAGGGAPPPALSTLPGANSNAPAPGQSSVAHGGVITMAHLRRIATVLNEDVEDALLRDMILTANGDAGISRGVDQGQFDCVMRDAGVWNGR